MKKNKFDIETSFSKKKRSDGTLGFRLGICEESSRTFRELIKPYLVDVMKYKVTDGNRWHL